MLDTDGGRPAQAGDHRDVGNWHVHGARSSFGNNRVDFGDWRFPVGTNGTAFSSFWYFIDGEIYNAYSNLQSDAMQKHFCAISNKVVRLGKERLAVVLSPFEASFGARFCHSDIKTLKFSSVSEFDRFIKANT